jgi:hypothetical protein
MRKMLTGLCVLALGAGLLTACSESRTDRVGERPADRTPSASPPSATSPSPSTTPSTPPSSSTSPSGSASSPSGSPSSPTGTGTR